MSLHGEMDEMWLLSLMMSFFIALSVVYMKSVPCSIKENLLNRLSEEDCLGVAMLEPTSWRTHWTWTKEKKRKEKKREREYKFDTIWGAYRPRGSVCRNIFKKYFLMHFFHAVRKTISTCIHFYTLSELVSNDRSLGHIVKQAMCKTICNLR